jgi:hypothetical protein
VKRKLPEPEFVTADTPHLLAYAWKCSGYGLDVLGDTRGEARAAFRKAYLAEYGAEFDEVAPAGQLELPL